MSHLAFVWKNFIENWLIRDNLKIFKTSNSCEKLDFPRWISFVDVDDLLYYYNSSNDPKIFNTGT